MYNDTLTKSPEFFPVKHRYAGNWLKMYDKFGQVLRIETVINQPRCFKVCRWGTKKSQRVRDWFPLTKSVAFLGRFAELSRQATSRYLDALAVVEDPRVSAKVLDRACNPVSLVMVFVISPRGDVSLPVLAT